MRCWYIIFGVRYAVGRDCWWVLETRAGVLLAGVAGVPGGVFTARLLGATGANQSACGEDYLRILQRLHRISLFHWPESINTFFAHIS
jgi:hypothetical protein